MFSRSKLSGSKRGYNFGNSSKESYGKKKSGKTLIIFNKRNRNKNNNENWKNSEHDDEDHRVSVITTSDSRMESLSDIAEGVQPVGKLTTLDPSAASSSSLSTQQREDDDVDELDAIKEDCSEPPDFENATSQQGMTEKKNGFNNHGNNNVQNQKKDNDNECCVNCLYFTQQCCECVIL